MAVELKKEIWECPGEAHNMDMQFNPSTQGPYGDGYHDCHVCDGEFYVSYRIYKEEIEHQEHMAEWIKQRNIRLAEEKEQQKLVDKIMSFPKLKVTE